MGFDDGMAVILYSDTACFPIPFQKTPTQAGEEVSRSVIFNVDIYSHGAKLTWENINNMHTFMEGICGVKNFPSSKTLHKIFRHFTMAVVTIFREMSKEIKKRITKK